MDMQVYLAILRRNTNRTEIFIELWVLLFAATARYMVHWSSGRVPCVGRCSCLGGQCESWWLLGVSDPLVPVRLAFRRLIGSSEPITTVDGWPVDYTSFNNSFISHNIFTFSGMRVLIAKHNTEKGSLFCFFCFSILYTLFKGVQKWISNYEILAITWQMNLKEFGDERRKQVAERHKRYIM